MAMSDPLGRHAHSDQERPAGAPEPSSQSPASKIRANVLEVLQREGYIRGFTREDLRPGSPSSRSSSNMSTASR